ncbi:MAG: aromatic amino acid lyase [Egibacteraceae bacterium]
MAHAFQTLVGVGTLADGTAAAQGLAAREVRPYAPAEKEGIALLAGPPGTVASAIGRIRDARVLTRQMLASAASATDALRASLDPYDPQVARLAPRPAALGGPRAAGHVVGGLFPAARLPCRSASSRRCTRTSSGRWRGWTKTCSVRWRRSRTRRS